MIIIVDDHPHVGRVIAKLLEVSGHQARHIVNPLEALPIMQSTPTALLAVLDVMMPEMNGIELARRMKADPAVAHVPIVVYSADGQDATRKAALAAGACEYIEKGAIGFDELCKRMIVHDYDHRTTPAEFPFPSMFIGDSKHNNSSFLRIGRPELMPTSL